MEVEGSLPHKRAPYIDYLANLQSSTITFKTYHTTRTSSDLMTVVSQTALTHAATWFPGKPLTGYTALPCEDSESKHHDVEACSLRPGSDIETASPATNRPTPPRARIRILDALKTSATVVASGLLSALYFSWWMWFAGGYLLYSSLRLAPYTSMDPTDMFRASLAGAPVVALAVSAATLVLSRPPETWWERREVAKTVVVACALLSVFAMPLGFAMMPHLMREGFGVRHALVLSGTGLGVLVAAFFLVLPQ